MLGGKTIALRLVLIVAMLVTGALIDCSLALPQVNPDAQAQINARRLFFDAYELMKDGELRASAAKFEEGLKIEPNDAVAHFYLGEVYLQLKDKAKARLHYRESLKVDADSGVAANARAQLAKISGNAFVPKAKGKSASSTRAPVTYSKDCDVCPSYPVETQR